jgi:DtxR family Mn-dependent transcriptional regulator
MSTGQHHAVRRDPEALASETVEDYAKAIFALQRRAGGPVGTSAIANRLGLSPASVTAMLKRMHAMKLVAREPYRGVTLTPAGEKVALEVMRHHRLLEAYLTEALGMPWDRVHDEAEVLEHYISEELEERIATALGDPDRDPHGDPIPDRGLSLDSEHGIALAKLEPGASGVFSRVSDSDPRMLRYLAECNIHPGASLRVIRVQPFGGPVLVDVGGREHAIGGELASKMLVELEEAGA